MALQESDRTISCGDLMWSRASTVKSVSLCKPFTQLVHYLFRANINGILSRYVSLYKIGKWKILRERVKVKGISNPIFLIEV